MATRSSKAGHFAALAAFLILSSIAAAAESGKPSPKIEPRAEELLKKACATLAAEKNLEFHAEVTFDEVLPSGVKLQYAGALDLARELPDRLAVAFDSDLGSKRFWYDGKSVTLLDSAHKVYGSIPVESSIDGMLTEIQEKAKFTVPLSDFAVANPAEVLRRAIFGIYVGRGDVDGVTCDHLAFSGAEADFQIWLERGKQALPKKLVITYAKLPQSPQYTAVFSDWKFPGEIPASLFEPAIPEGTIRVDFLTIKKEAKP
jgi:hypothetical protein